MTTQEKDALVLAKLREHGPGTVTVKQLAAGAGLPRVTVRAAVDALAAEGLVCLVANAGETVYWLCHLHAEARECEQPLSCAIQEVHPDGQR